MNKITTMKLLDAVAIAKNGSNTTANGIDLTDLTPTGTFSLHYIITGTGTATITYSLCSTKSGTYVTPSGASAIATTVAAGSDILAFNPELAPYMKIIVTEDNVNPIVVTMWLNKQ